MEHIVYLKIIKLVIKIKALFVIFKTKLNVKLIIIHKIVSQLMGKIVIITIKVSVSQPMD
jgi:hypothetical protein